MDSETKLFSRRAVNSSSVNVLVTIVPGLAAMILSAGDAGSVFLLTSPFIDDLFGRSLFIPNVIHG